MRGVAGYGTRCVSADVSVPSSALSRGETLGPFLPGEGSEEGTLQFVVHSRKSIVGCRKRGPGILRFSYDHNTIYHVRILEKVRRVFHFTHL